MNYTQLLTGLGPEALVVLAVLGVLFVDAAVMRGETVSARLRWAAGLTVFGCGAAAAALYLLPSATPLELGAG